MNRTHCFSQILQFDYIYFPGFLSVLNTNFNHHSIWVAQTNKADSERDNVYKNRIEKDKAQTLKTCKKYGLTHPLPRDYKYTGKYRWIQEKHIGWCFQSKVSKVIR